VIKKILIIILAVSCFNPLYGDLSSELDDIADAGYPVAFLFLPVGAKAIGMAEACAAGSSDVTAAFYNPAALVNIEYSSLSITGMALSMDRYAGTISTGFKRQTKSGRQEVFGFGASYITVSDIMGYDGSGSATSEIAVFSGFGQFSYASSFNANLKGGSWGISVKGIYDSLDDTKGVGAAISLGADVMIAPSMLRCGISLKNFGLMSYDETYWLKPLFSTAFRVRVPTIPAAFIFQFDKHIGLEKKTVFKVAAEYTVFSKKPDKAEAQYRDALNAIRNDNIDKQLSSTPKVEDERGYSLVLRTGYSSGKINGGFTLQFGKMEISYAIGFDSFEEGANNILTLGYNF